MDRWSMLLLVGVVGLLLGALIGSAITSSVARRRARKQEVRPHAAVVASDGRMPVEPDWTVAVTGAPQAPMVSYPAAQPIGEPMAPQPQPSLTPPMPVQPFVQPAWPADGTAGVWAQPAAQPQPFVEQPPVTQPMAPQPQPSVNFGLQPPAQAQSFEAATAQEVQPVPPAEPVSSWFVPEIEVPQAASEQPTAPILREDTREELFFGTTPDAASQSFSWPSIEGLTQTAPAPHWGQPLGDQAAPPREDVVSFQEPAPPVFAPEPPVLVEPPIDVPQSGWQPQPAREPQPAAKQTFAQDLSLEADLQATFVPVVEPRPAIDLGVQPPAQPAQFEQPTAPAGCDTPAVSQPEPARESGPITSPEPVSQFEPTSQFGPTSQFEPITQFEPVPETIFVPEPIFEEIPQPDPVPPSAPETVPATGAQPMTPRVPETTSQSIAEALASLRFEPKPLTNEVTEEAVKPEPTSNGPLDDHMPAIQTPDVGLDEVDDIVLVPGLLEEPLPGAGWASAAKSVDEEAVEQAFEAQSSRIIQQTAESMAPEMPAAPAAPLVTPLSAEDLKARIEETRRRIRQELEQPFFSGYKTESDPPEPEAIQTPLSTRASTPSPMPVPARPEAPIAPVEPDYGFNRLDPSPDDSPVVELLPESSVIPNEPDLWFGSGQPGDPAPQAGFDKPEPKAEWQFDMPTQSEPLTAEAIFAEAASRELSLTQSWEIPEWSSVDDTTSGGGSSDAWLRVEEPQPLVSPIPLAMEPPMPAAAEPMAAPAPAPAPVTPVAVATPVVQPVEIDLDFDSASVDSLSGGASADPDPDDDGPLGAIKSKIEQTRGRLKAKAFDAMMNGEASLLADGPTDGLRGVGGKPVLDDDLDQTIETSLSEGDC